MLYNEHFVMNVYVQLIESCASNVQLSDRKC